ncbi:MAG: mercuric ion transport protein [Cellvibrionaceae bacterium]|jgi:mercuric ion transport protein
MSRDLQVKSMAETEMSNEKDQSRSQWLATASISGALIASSCCIVPLLLVTLGISGAWIGNLTALEPYKAYFLSITVLLLGFGFWYVYFKPKKDCEEGSYCARPSSARMTKSALWIATVIVLLSATVDFWAPLFY